MTDRPDLAALRALAEAATPGPWRVSEHNPGLIERPVTGVGWRGPTHADGRPEWHRLSGADLDDADAAYIAACSPERILALIAEVEACRGRAARDGVSVEVGQLWADNDSRESHKGRRQHLRLVAIDGDRVHLNDEDTGRSTWVLLRRMRPNSTGYRLVEEGARHAR